jgi:SAM-dependent methyltransferase
MRSFGTYSRYYDLLYQDKDYEGEAAYVSRVLRERCGTSRGLRILELGAGTGRHARRLAADGHDVEGVDLSDDMVVQARAELEASSADVRARVRFRVGDVRDVRTGEHYDAVVSLFHVMSYQTSMADLEAAFATARAHLHPGGVFFFDAWYGPGVLTTPPVVRVKRVSGSDLSILRLSEPTVFVNDSRVDVRFTLYVSSPAGSIVDVVEEVHRMRYWFHPEVEGAAARTGFEVAQLREWMTERSPDATTWNACWALTAVP